MNFYEILKVSKNSSQQEIKQSYKKLILQHHPDKGGNEEIFKQIQEAYETLGNAEKRMIYDNPRQINNGIHISFQNGFMNIVRQFQKPIEKINIKTTFNELYNNFSKTIELPYNIKIEYPLFRNNIQLQGEPSNFLIINEIIDIPKHFQIVNNFDLIFIKEINFYECLTGVQFSVELPNEILNIKKTSIIKDKDIFSIPNKGLFKNSNERGNLLINFVLIYPTLDEEKLKKLGNLF